jgi:hypothetical protein
MLLVQLFEVEAAENEHALPTNRGPVRSIGLITFASASIRTPLPAIVDLVQLIDPADPVVFVTHVTVKAVSQGLDAEISSDVVDVLVIPGRVFPKTNKATVSALATGSTTIWVVSLKALFTVFRTPEGRTQLFTI